MPKYEIEIPDGILPEGYEAIEYQRPQSPDDEWLSAWGELCNGPSECIRLILRKKVPQPRPYESLHELEALVGGMVRHKPTGNVLIVGGFVKEDAEVFIVNYGSITASTLFEQFEFLDGKPCGTE